MDIEMIKRDFNDTYSDAKKFLYESKNNLRRLMVIADKMNREDIVEILNDANMELLDVISNFEDTYDMVNVENESLNESTNDEESNGWCGIPDVKFIWHGQWSDPELEHNGYVANYWDIEDSMYQFMKERIADGEKWGDPENDDDFCKFCAAHADSIRQDIEEMGEPIVDTEESDNENETEQNYEPITIPSVIKNDIIALVNRDAEDMDWDIINDIVNDDDPKMKEHFINCIIEDICDANEIDASEIEKYHSAIENIIIKELKKFV